MSQTVRSGNGRFENPERAYEQARHRQQRQLTQLFVLAGVSAVPLHHGHTGTLSANDLAKIINVAVGRQRIEVLDPLAFHLGER